ncbi:MAG: metal-sensitive transcriptional regulator [Candidatus Omnitrophota bacterium]
MTKNPSHEKNLIALKRIEGQIRGIQKMIGEGKYCIDIVTQIHAAVNALHSVSEKILTKHIEHCVVDTFRDKSEKDRIRKINELMGVIKKLHKM